MEATLNPAIGQPVKVCLFDGEIKDQPGKVFGRGTTSKGEIVYLVEMANEPPDTEHTTGAKQVEHGKPWVLSVYAEELRASE